MITPEQKSKIMELSTTLYRSGYGEGMVTQRHYDAPNDLETRNARNRSTEMRKAAQTELQQYLESLL